MSYSMNDTTADVGPWLTRVVERDRAAVVRSDAMAKAAGPADARARYHRCPQSQSAPARRSATKIGLGLGAVRNEAELSEHEKSVPIPAKVLNLAISRDTHERRGNTHRLVGRRYRLGSPEGAGVRPRVNHLEDERGTLAENPLLRPDSGTKLRGLTHHGLRSG